MPNRSCHPGKKKKLNGSDVQVSSLMLDIALESILKQVTVDRKHDIPYLAGYSKNGKTIYIDRHLPARFICKGKKVDAHRYLIFHEAIEDTLIRRLKLNYQHAHQIALRAEQAAVRADHISWREYDKFMQSYIKEAESEQLKHVPADLDLKPYRDEQDVVLLRRLEKTKRRTRKS